MKLVDLPVLLYLFAIHSSFAYLSLYPCPSSSSVQSLRRTGESEGVSGSSPSAGLHSSAYEHVLPAYTCSNDYALACTSHCIWNSMNSKWWTSFVLSICCSKSMVNSFLLSFQVPVPMVIPPQNKEMKDAAVQSEPLAVREEKQIDGPVSTAGEGLGKVGFLLFCCFFCFGGFFALIFMPPLQK